MADAVTIIILCAIATYVTRTGGHIVLSRFGTLNHRLEAALNAVPAAVLTALVAPYAVTNGPVEGLAILLSLFFSWRFSMIHGIIAGLVVLGLYRNFI
ncbi:MAG: AzlD domain-containing protein [Sneathiellales bacterium]|nr:AzlD domain-containing protein [Sneathiellales bacterium]